MARPQRLRRICCVPSVCSFNEEGKQNGEPVILSLDEYEVIRLVDLEGMTHGQCACQMDVSRSTVQEIYAAARRKIAGCIVNGRQLIISGGSYRVCGGKERARCSGPRACAALHDEKGTVMKIAVTYENGQIYQHFGHTEQFKLYSVEDGAVTGSEVVDTNGSGHGALAGFLLNHGVDVLVCGGIGGGAQAALAQAGIRLFGGVSGSADEAVKALLSGGLSYDPDVHCDHHDHENGGHSCGDHGCGHHGCH